MRPDQSSATVRLHYLKDGTVNFAFTINRAEYFLPVVLLFRALREVRVIKTTSCGVAFLRDSALCLAFFWCRGDG